MAAKKSRKPDGLRQPAWLTRVMRSDEETWRALVPLLGDLQGVARYRIDKGKLAVIDARTDAVIREIRAGRLRGRRAERKVEAIDNRLLKMIHATYRPCPMCSQTLAPDHFAEKVEARIVYEPPRDRPGERWWVAELPGVASQGKTKASARRNLLSALADIEAARADGLVK